MAPIAITEGSSIPPLTPYDLPLDYVERVYAGVLGKLVGVYLGRPFEGWTHQRIMSELGHIRYYVHERYGKPCVVTDDDVSGTFAFVRALEEHDGDVSALNIGKTWLNNVVEKKSVFWWGGRGISTEHTAYLNLKRGLPAPDSGSIQTNGKTVAEQIGAQIFIDGWALVSPCRPDLAAKMAKEAGSVSHDGDSVSAAMLWAAMEAEAFRTNDVDTLIDVGLRFIPPHSLLAVAIEDVRQWCRNDQDWLVTRQHIEDKYGYDKFCGMCHVIPNHCIMIMSLIYGGHDFDLAMEIVNTSGWDTDCNSGNLGCLVAIMHGMSCFSKTDWRGPIADRALISSADNGYSMNNAARITYDVVNMGRRLAGKAALPEPKGSQFHFSLPGSIQGFQSSGTIQQALGAHGPALRIRLESAPVEVMTETSAPKDILNMGPTYPLSSSPLVYPGQSITATLYSSSSAKATLRMKYMTGEGDLVSVDGPSLQLDDDPQSMTWKLPSTPESLPIAQIGVQVDAGEGHVYLDRLGWSGEPHLTLRRPESKPHPFWDLQWVQNVTDWRPFGATVFIANDTGEGVVTYGTRDWKNYRIQVADFTIKLGKPAGVLIRCLGLRRWYGLFLDHGRVYLVKTKDEKRVELATAGLSWQLDQKLQITLQAVDTVISAEVGGVRLQAEDVEFGCGGIGFAVTDGALSSGPINIQGL